MVRSNVQGGYYVDIPQVYMSFVSGVLLQTYAHDITHCNNVHFIKTVFFLIIEALLQYTLVKTGLKMLLTKSAVKTKDLHEKLK